MTLYLLDTDTFSLYQNTHPQVVVNIVRHRFDRLVLSVITVDEQVSGWLTALRRAKSPAVEANMSRRLAEAVESYSGWPVLPMNLAALARYQSLVNARLNIRADDARIAAIALENGAVVVTRNLRDFRRVPGLAVVDWSV